MFRVIIPFADMYDNGYIYKVGEEFPRAGTSASKKRLEELSSNRNRRGVALIVDETHGEAPPVAGEHVENTNADVDPPKTAKTKRRPQRGHEKNA